MQQTFPISDQEIEALASNAVSRVFGTMLDASVVLKGRKAIEPETREAGVSLPGNESGSMITGTVGFIGKMTGIIYIYMGMPLAMKATSRLLGLGPEDIEAEECEAVNDAVGELTNMIVGSFKNELSDKGYECRMTIPSILRGSKYSIEPAEAAMRRIFYYECEGSPFVIDILMKEEASAEA